MIIIKYKDIKSSSTLIKQIQKSYNGVIKDRIVRMYLNLKDKDLYSKLFDQLINEIFKEKRIFKWYIFLSLIWRHHMFINFNKIIY